MIEDLMGSRAVDRSGPPAAGEPSDFTFPPFHVDTLDNGLRLVALPEPTTPLVALEIVSHAGGLYDPPERPGLASLHGGLLDEGTERHDALELALRAESLGGSLTSGAGWHLSYAEIGLLSRHLDAGLGLLAELMLEARLPDDQIERLRGEQLAEVLRRSSLPSALADDRFASIVFAGTPYSHPVIGTDESLRAMTRDELLTFSERHVAPSTSTILAVGDFELETLRDAVGSLFGGWSGPVRQPDPDHQPLRIPATEVHIVDRPNAAQTQLAVGHDGPPRRHQDFPALRVMNTLFGGKFTSRINLNLRERHGYTYGATSRFLARRHVGSFQIGGAIANEGVGHSVREIVAEIERLQNEPPSRDELLDTREYLLGSFPGSLQTVDDLAARLEALIVHELPLDEYDRFPAVLGEVEADDVQRAAQDHLRPDALAVVAVGPAETLQPQLEGLGPVTVWPV